MPAAAANLVLNLTAPANQTATQSTRSSIDAQTQFSDTLTQQIQTRQADELSANQHAALPAAAAATPVVSQPSQANNASSTATNTASSKSGATAQAQDSKSTGDATAQDQSATSSTAGQSPSSAVSASTSNSSNAHGPSKDNGKAQDITLGDAQSTDVSMAQLQSFMVQGLPSTSLATDAEPSKLADASDISKGLVDTQAVKAHLHALGASRQGVQDAAEADNLEDLSKSVSAKIDASRQALPGNQITERATQSFSELLSSRTQTVDPATVRQQAASTVTGQHADAIDETEGGDPLKADAKIYEAVGSDGWDRALGNKMVMMVSNQQQEVEMQLNPPHLGPLSVKLTLDQNQASVTFTTAHEPVRNAIEASMPRLNQMMAESGIQLGQTNVQSHGQDANSNQSGQGSGRRASSSAARPIEGQEGFINTSSWGKQLKGGLPGNVNLFV
jgi:flagellar hook-length control protein FliK